MGGSAVQGDEPSLRTAIGDSVGGFTLVRQLGSGGMGSTWEAVRRVGDEFEQRVAVKLGSPELLRHAEGRDLLRREASLAASLRHPNIASVLDWNEERGYIICELVEGADLRSVLREAPSGRLHPPLLVYMIAQIARGLSHAHRRLLHGQPSPVIHRDMSPGNVVVDYDGNLKIVDFGIAKAVSSAEWTQSIKGKLPYMAPEQATGGPLDGRVDQYALGVIAYEAATGMRPNDGAHDGETLAKILDGQHVPVGRIAPNLPSGLVEIIERMLALRADDRFASMDAVIDALEALTPPLTIHRSLAALVHRAHPPHTIVQEGNRFVSRPVVTFEVPPRDPLAFGPPPMHHTPSSVRALAASYSQRPIQPFRLPDAGRHEENSPQKSGPRMRAGEGATFRSLTARRAVLLGAAVALITGLVAWIAFSPTPIAAPSAQLQTAPPAAATQAPKSAPEAAAPGAASEAPAPAQGVDPRAGAQAANDPATPPRAVADESEPRPRARRGAASESVPSEDAQPPIRKRASAEGALGTSHASAATVRVKVFPWGRVWVDGRMRGAVPPILSVKLSAGTHTVAVGHDKPGESRVVTLAPGDNQLISFDLGSW